MFPLEGSDINTSVAGDSNLSDIVYTSRTRVIRAYLKSINKRNPTVFAIAEVTESELEDDNLGLEQVLESEFDGVDGGHEANAVLHPPEGIAKGVRGSETLMTWFTTKKVTLINSVISATSCKGDVTTYHSSSVSN